MNAHPYLVGYDGSEASRKAVIFAKERAKRDGCGILLIHVIDWSPFEFHTLEENAHRSAEHRTQIEQDRRELFPPILALLAADGVTAKTSIQYGHPAETIVQFAKARDVQGIIVGRTGHTKLKGLLFGTVASHVVSLADRPVTVVP